MTTTLIADRAAARGSSPPFRGVGVDGFRELAVELSLRLASAGAACGDQGVAAVDLAEVWFVG
jgi:hypothetical protein